MVSALRVPGTLPGKSAWPATTWVCTSKRTPPCAEAATTQRGQPGQAPSRGTESWRRAVTRQGLNAGCGSLPSRRQRASPGASSSARHIPLVSAPLRGSPRIAPLRAPFSASKVCWDHALSLPKRPLMSPSQRLWRCPGKPWGCKC